MARLGPGRTAALRIGADSIIGGREYQQDYGLVYESEQGVLAAVCDGMGGMEGGEIASKTAVETLVSEFRSRTASDSVPEFFRRSAEKMDKVVSELKAANGERLGAGTTFVGAWISEDRFYWVSVGDSKIWLIRQGKMISINREHNYELLLKSRLEKKEITREFYENKLRTARMDALISYIGMNGLALTDVNEKPIVLEPGDVIILCSDGVYKSLDDARVQALVEDNDIDLNIAAERVNAMALHYGGMKQDNTTTIILEYRGK